MKLRIGYRKRRAISPVIAEVMLMVITLIVSVSLAGYVFGLMGTYARTAEVSASVEICSSGTGVCTITLTNLGSSNTATTGCSFAGGAGVESAENPPTGLTSQQVGAGQSVTTYCVTSSPGTPGSEVAGSVSLGNGEAALFVGTWS